MMIFEWLFYLFLLNNWIATPPRIQDEEEQEEDEEEIKSDQHKKNKKAPPGRLDEVDSGLGVYGKSEMIHSPSHPLEYDASLHSLQSPKDVENEMTEEEKKWAERAKPKVIISICWFLLIW